MHGIVPTRRLEDSIDLVSSLSSPHSLGQSQETHGSSGLAKASPSQSCFGQSPVSSLAVESIRDSGANTSIATGESALNIPKPRRVAVMPKRGTGGSSWDLGNRLSSALSHNHSLLPSGPMFVDTSAMKKRMREALYKKPYNVFDFYKEHGVCQAIAKNWYFENITLAVILFNALWIMIDTDCNPHVLWEAHPVFQIAEHSLCAFYVFEWVVRFGSFASKWNCFRDAWFMFDSVLVGLTVLETWVFNFIMMAVDSGGNTADSGMGSTVILRMARLLRLSRMARMARLFRIMPELMILLKGMLAAIRSVLFTMALLGILMYVYAIAFTQLTEDTDMGKEYFNTVPEAMVSLLLFGTLKDNVGDVAKAIGGEGIFYGLLFTTFVLLAALTVMNMLIGILCEVVSSVATVEKEEMVIMFVKNKMQQLLDSGVDEDDDHMISKDEFLNLLHDESAVSCLQEVGVDVVGLVDFAEFIFECDESHEEKKLNFADFMEEMLQLRGTKEATVKDVVDLRKYLRTKHKEVLRVIQEANKRERIWMDRMDTGGTSCRRMSAMSSPKAAESESKRLTCSEAHATGDEVTLLCSLSAANDDSPEGVPELNEEVLQKRVDELARRLRDATRQLGDLQQTQESVERISVDATSELDALREIVARRG